MTYQNLIVETRGKVGIIRLNRPAALNALNAALMTELMIPPGFELADGESLRDRESLTASFYRCHFAPVLSHVVGAMQISD